MTTRTDTCGTCKFFASDIEADYDQCRYHPPTGYHPGTIYEFPAVTANMWCGKHEKADAPKTLNG